MSGSEDVLPTVEAVSRSSQDSGTQYKSQIEQPLSLPHRTIHLIPTNYQVYMQALRETFCAGCNQSSVRAFYLLVRLFFCKASSYICWPWQNKKEVVKGCPNEFSSYFIIESL
jgi:hypothetical protein